MVVAMLFNFVVSSPILVVIFLTVLSPPTPSDAYIVERVEFLNGKRFTIREEQPFYRVYHRPHFKAFRPKIQIVEVDEAGNVVVATTEKTSADQHDLNTIGHHKSSIFDMFTSRLSSISASFGSGGRTEPVFGHHHLPPGERRNDAKWPTKLLPYVKCMDLACQCPLFNGTVEGKACLLPNGRRLEKALRKDYRQYTREERAEFLSAMWRMKKDGMYNNVSMVHRRAGIHSGPSFFPWHREYMKRLEMIFRVYANGTRLGLPYWDSTLDNNLPEPKDSVMFSDWLMGESLMQNYGLVVTGPFAYWTPIDGDVFAKGRPSFQRMLAQQSDGEFINEARIEFVLNQTEIKRVMAFTLPLHSCTNYTLDERFLEYSHDYVHYYVSGDMHERYSSANDPLFIMHHGFIDLIWEKWRHLRQTRHQREHDYPEDNGECMPVWQFSDHPMPLLELTNREGLSNAYTDILFEYAPRPKCRVKSNECDSEFLFCDTRTNVEQPICSARVKLGGNCTGFEWSKEVCYEGKCVEGRCRSSTIRVLSDGDEARQSGKKIKGSERLEKSALLVKYMK